MRYALLRGVIRGVTGIVGLVPRKAGLAFFAVAGNVIYSIPHADRKRTLTHLRSIYGGRWSEMKIRTVARGVYRELGKNFYDAFYLARAKPEIVDRLIKTDPLEPVRSAYAEGRGCIMITAHTGCFEMLLPLFSNFGFRCFAIGKKLHDEGLDKLISRERSGNDSIYMDRSEGTGKILRLLREGRMFGVLIDQDISVEGVFADFLGKPANTPSGPVKMAMRFDIPLFVVTTARQRNNTHYVYINGPVPMENSGTAEDNLVKNIGTVNRIICDTIERYPEQWVWMHRRWHRKPAAEHGTTGAAT
ncbi:MAG: lysophospholipid acyltransferase family protein [Chitinispirillaceae bacterium]|nr:lysophospholipid acyltransferase family protein [Chitinispirillaceae bacterium]